MESVMENMIAAVKEQPCLWNPLHGEYRDPGKKEEAWKAVVRAINHKAISNVVIAKIEWRRLRDNHRDALKRAKLGKNKLLPAQITTWKYAKAMQFLEPYMKYRITEHIEMDAQPKNCEQDVSTTEVAAHNPPIAKRPKFDEASTSQIAPETHRVTDSFEAFFNCIKQSTRELPPWMQTDVKKKIFAVVMEAETLANERNYYNKQTNSPEVAFDNKISVNVKLESEVDVDEECIY